MATTFAAIIDKFLGKVTDDMYLELTYEDTIKDGAQFLLDAIPYFEFPRFALYDYDEKQQTYNINLTQEEINILALLMKTAWLDRQINSIENVRMKYSGSDFKFTSQANHLSKLLQLKTENIRETTHAQRLYKRRRIDATGVVESNWNIFDTGVYRSNTQTTTTTTSGSSINRLDESDWEPISDSSPSEQDNDDYMWENF